MKMILNDIISVITSIGKIDLLLYFSVLVLIILVVSLIYIIKNEEENPYIEQTKETEEDLKSIVDNIENSTPVVSEFTEYEKEQEERAIISYEELLAKSKLGKINYEEENRVNDEISIRKINVDSLVEKPKEIQTHKNVVFCNYKREEEFLDTLKSLNKIIG